MRSVSFIVAVRLSKYRVSVITGVTGCSISLEIINLGPGRCLTAGVSQTSLILT